MKPAKAKPTKPGPFDALEPLPTDAWGLSRIKPGFASSDRAATLLGLGYPHIILPSTEDFTGTDQELFKRQDLRVIPRNAIERLYRAHTHREGPLSLAEEVKHIMHRGGSYVVFLLEAMFGTEATARAFVKQLISYPTEEWSGGDEIENYGWMMIKMFAYTLWRVPAKVRVELRGELGKLFERVSKGKPPKEWWRPTQALDMILNGKAAVERCGSGYNGQTHLSELLYAEDDPAWLATKVTERLATLRPVDGAGWDIQFAVIGGPKVLAALRDNIKRFKADQKKSIEVQLSLVA